MEVRILDQRLRDWGLPRFQSEGAAAVDLFACVEEPETIAAEEPAVLIGTGIAISFDNDLLAGIVLPRSGLGHRKGLVLGNTVGLIDPDYDGEILISAWNRNPAGTPPIEIRPGDRIGQLMFVPIVRPRFDIVETFSRKTTRGSGGFGSTDTL